MTDTWSSSLSASGALGHAQFAPAPAGSRASITPLLQEASILVRGEDAAAFLQSQLSNDIRRVSATQGQLAAYCTPKGRVLATLSVWPHEAGYVLRLPVQLADAIRTRLRKYVLRSRVALEDISDQVALLGLAGARSVPRFQETFGAAALGPFAVVQTAEMSAMALSEERLEVAIQRLSGGSMRDRLLSAGWALASQEQWELAGIAAGIPTVLPATSDQFVPQMLNLELIGAVAFDKGCYPGQEIVARSQYRGQVKRRLQRFVSLQPTQPGAEVHTADGAVAGMVVNVARAAVDRYELLAVVSTETLSAPLHIAGTAGPALQQLPLPYTVPSSERNGD